MHTAGIAAKTQHIRDGVELAPIGDIEYDFNRQTYTSPPKERKILVLF